MSKAIDYIYGPNQNQVVGLLEVYPVTLLLSIVFSLPTFFVYLSCFYFLLERKANFWLSKFILIAISVLGIFITLRKMDRDIIIAYSLTNIFVGLLLILGVQKSNQIR